MRTDDFDFDLPDELIAQVPAEKRGDDKLLVLDQRTGDFSDHKFSELVDLIPKDSLMVFNNSRVRKARVFGTKLSTGAHVEFLFLTAFAGGKVWKVLARRGKRQHIGDTYRFPDGSIAAIVDAETVLTAFEMESVKQTTEQPEKSSGGSDGVPFYEESEKFLQFEHAIADLWFDNNGHIPLPPYIKREDTADDAVRYQNVYADQTGSVACPTAGLHFTDELLAKIDERGIKRLNITLHVGLGTFLPVRVDNIEEHKMHYEDFYISDEAAETVERQKASGKSVIAVGTTSVRALEGGFADGHLKRGWQSSNIFIYPPYQFKVVDKLLTNFHTPKSTLLMLVSALAGREHILAAYKHAVDCRYRFFSYGDAMFIV